MLRLPPGKPPDQASAVCQPAAQCNCEARIKLIISWYMLGSMSAVQDTLLQSHEVSFAASHQAPGQHWPAPGHLTWPAFDEGLLSNP